MNAAKWQGKGFCLIYDHARLKPDCQEAILLLHPMLANARMMQKLLSGNMGAEYRCLIPNLSGHGDAQDVTFRSAAEEARQLAGFLQENCVFACGEKDGDLKRARRLIPVKYPGAVLLIWPDCAHCGHITAGQEDYAAMLKQLLLTDQV